MPAELGPGPGRVSTLTEQQDFAEIAAKVCLGLITGTWVLVVRCHTVIVMLARPRSNPPGWPAHAGQWRLSGGPATPLGRVSATTRRPDGQAECGGGRCAR